MVEWTAEHIGWAVYFATYVLGDSATTVIGLLTPGVREGNRLLQSVFESVPVWGDIVFIVVVKAVITAALYGSTLLLSPRLQAVLVWVVALVGVLVVVNNAIVLRAALS